MDIKRLFSLICNKTFKVKLLSCMLTLKVTTFMKNLVPLVDCSFLTAELAEWRRGKRKDFKNIYKLMFGNNKKRF